MPAVGITECMQRNSPVKGSKTPALTYTTAKRKRTKALVSLLTCCNFSLCSDLKLVQPSYFLFFSFLSVFQLHKDTKMKHQCHPLFWRAARNSLLVLYTVLYSHRDADICFSICYITLQKQAETDSVFLIKDRIQEKSPPPKKKIKKIRGFF